MHIAYDCNGVVVRTADGRNFTARTVVSTLPLGVLLRMHAGLFEPPLPGGHVDVLTSGKVLMGNLTHVLLQFPTVWWDDRRPRWLSANAGTHGPVGAGEFSEWQNLNYFLPGTQTLLSFIAHPQSTAYEAQPDAVVRDAVMARLRAQHPHVAVPEPTAFHISRHGYDPLSYGAYTSYAPGWREVFTRTLAAPLTAEPCGTVRVRFAGEATCSLLNGYTHGALASGREAAAHILYAHGLGPKPSASDQLNLCNW